MPPDCYSQMPATGPEYVSADKLAQMFDPPLSLCFIRSLQKRRTIPFIRLGRRVVFSPAAVRQALDQSHTVKPRSGRSAAACP
jgi:hypothetical protein